MKVRVPGKRQQNPGASRLRRLLAVLVFASCTAVAWLYWREPHIPQLNIEDILQNMPLPRVYYEVKPKWTWICLDKTCERLPANETAMPHSLITCNMLCSKQLWPQPTGTVQLASAAVPVQAETFTLKIKSSPSEDVSNHLVDAFELFKDDMRMLEQNNKEPKRTNTSSQRNVVVHVTIEGSSDPRLRLDTDESYKLYLQLDGKNPTLVAEISAHSFCGARHGLETLSQLIWMDPHAGSLFALESAVVQDTPKFKYRGLLLDTARNFFPVSDILRTIDAMAANKLNTFHWHATDSQSFPLKLDSVPHLAQYGAYGPNAIYTPENIRTVVRRARLRGIRVLIEVDAPAHVGRAWGWGPSAELGDLAYCIEEAPWNKYCGEPPCGQLNPLNPHVFHLLRKIYAEIIELTGVDDVFHLGNDEVKLDCWLHHIVNATGSSNPTELWLGFLDKAYQALEKANGGKAPELTLLWSSKLINGRHLKRLDAKRFGVQVWHGENQHESRFALDAGFRAVLSHVNAWYLDCGFGSWRDSGGGECEELRSWQNVYEHRPWTSKKWRIEGGEVCQWTELLGPGGLDARLWPRASAFAERMWSDPEGKATGEVPWRLDVHRSRLVAKGVGATPLWSQWCTNNPQACL